jgi:DNA helicase-2/ATP-dependent DNA helicase PcrA
VTHILRFKHDWPEAKVVRLEDNYRSTAAILEYANTLIAFNRNRHDKVLKAATPGGTRPGIMQCQDEVQESQRVVEDIRQQIEMRLSEPRDVAILCRTNEQPRSFETELRRANIPYVLIGGMSFFDRKEVRDILSYLRVIDNPHDEPSLMRIINQPARGIGNAAQKRLLEEATTRGKFLWDVLPDALLIDGIEAKTAAAVGGFRRLIEELAVLPEKFSIAQLVAKVIDRTNYRDALVKLYPDPAERETRLASLEEIVNAAASYDNSRRKKSQPSLSEFLDDMLLNDRDDSDEKESQLKQNAVALMTLHSAKGLEFPRVYLVGMEEGILPHKRSLDMENDSAIDEERRLCYVGVTRAREHLTLSFTLTRRKWGKPQPTVPSRFLYEMTGQAESFPPKKPTDNKPAGRRKGRRAAKR